MTTLTMRRQRGYLFVVSPDTKIMKFKSRQEAKDWCVEHHPGLPIIEIDAHKGMPKGRKTGWTRAPNRRGRLDSLARPSGRDLRRPFRFGNDAEAALGA